MADSPREIMHRYLEDAIAAERNFESQLNEMAREGDDPTVQSMFAQHAEETRHQHMRLEARLEALGGSVSGIKSFLAHIFNTAPKIAQLGHDEAEKTTQNLLIAYAVENSEVAMYEALAAVAESAGGAETASLAREIQMEERATAEKVWRMIDTTARAAYSKLVSVDTGRGMADPARSGRRTM